MRLIVLGVYLFAAACNGQALNSPTSPTNASLGPAQTAARGGTALPFSGSYTTVIDVPPPFAHATLEGIATHLGRFTGTLTAEVNWQYGYGEIQFHCGEWGPVVWHFVG